MKTKIISLTLLVVCFWIFCTQTQASPITIEITGNITSASGNDIPGTIHTGVGFTGSYTYDSSTPDSDTDPSRGVYQHDSPYGLSLNLGGYEFKTTPGHTGQFEMRILNDLLLNGVKDYYIVFSHENVSIPSAGFNIDSIRWDLWDSTHTALSSEGLPINAPILTNWDHNALSISGSDSLGHGVLIQGTITQAILVPEPLTMTLMTMGIFFLRRRR